MFKFIKEIFARKPEYLRTSTVKVFRDSSEVAARLVVLARTRSEVVAQEAGDANRIIEEIDDQIKMLCRELGAYEYAHVPDKFILRIAKKTFESCAK